MFLAGTGREWTSPDPVPACHASTSPHSPHVRGPCVHAARWRDTLTKTFPRDNPMTHFNHCPNCMRTAKAGFFCLPFPIYECKACNTLYCPGPKCG